MNKKRITLLTAVLVVVLTGIAFASSDGGHADGGVLMKDFMYRCFNFAIAFGILAFFITKPIKKGLADRTSGIADQLAEQYAVYEDSLQRNEILVSVNNVQSVENFANLMSYLESITSIHSVNVAKVTASTIQLRVNLIGEQQSLMQAISLNSKLSIESTPSIDPTSVQTKLPALFFRWKPEIAALSLSE